MIDVGENVSAVFDSSLLDKDEFHSGDEKMVVSLSYNCFLVPVVVLFWWYWTRRMAQRVMVTVIAPTESSSPSFSEQEEPMCRSHDEFETWDEVVQNNTKDTSVGYVKWVKTVPYSPTAKPHHKRFRHGLKNILSRKKHDPLDVELTDSTVSYIKWETIRDDQVELVLSPGKDDDFELSYSELC